MLPSKIQRTYLILAIHAIFILNACQQKPLQEGLYGYSPTQHSTEHYLYNPAEDLGELFHDVQIARIFPDAKTFADCLPLNNPEQIRIQYLITKTANDLDLTEFVGQNFHCPGPTPPIQASVNKRSFEENILSLWDDLTRKPDTVTEFSSLIPLPYKYVVPGGRFREIYYWDSYFTMIGLAASGRMDLVTSMLDNFSYLIKRFGFIPNGNRTYYLSRSQPPFFSSMVMLYAQYAGRDKALQYLPFLEKEYAFWMDGMDKVNQQERIYKKVVWMEEDVILNRYWDAKVKLRPEGYLSDVQILKNIPENQHEEVMKDRRSTCESGWDFSSRWLPQAEDSIKNIATCDFIPVDLNCLLYHLETTIAQLNNLQGNPLKYAEFMAKAEVRKEAILRYCWNEKSHCFTDYDFQNQKNSQRITLAGNFPLYFKIATTEQAELQAVLMGSRFLFDGGLVTTLTASGEQWDYPNGWPPLQWISIKGLQHYGFEDLSRNISERWLHLNQRVYKETGKMMEKYNVVDTSLTAGGGEYPTVDGFGWTNGVAIALLREVEKY